MRSIGNPAFRRALHSLAHAVSLAAVILLLVNDHYLRLYHPSWLTGKLPAIRTAAENGRTKTGRA